MSDPQEYLDLLRQNIEAQNRAAAKSKRLADETARLADEERNRRKAEQTRLQMMTEIAAGAARSSETQHQTQDDLAALTTYIKLNFEAFKESLAEARFEIRSVTNRVNVIAGQLNDPEVLQELERIDQREPIEWQIDQYTRNLNDLLVQKAMQGAFPDVALLRQIEYIESQIKELQEELNELDKKTSQTDHKP